MLTIRCTSGTIPWSQSHCHYSIKNRSSSKIGEKNVIPTSVTPIISPIKSSIGSSADITSRIYCVVRLPNDVGGNWFDIVLGIAQILATEMIHGPTFMEKSIKPIKHKHVHIVPKIRRLVLILASIMNARTAHVGLCKARENRKEVKC